MWRRAAEAARTLANRVRLQREGVEVMVVVADYQVVTDRDRVADISTSSWSRSSAS